MPRTRATEFTPATRRVILERDGSRCVRCLRAVEGAPASIHHRKLRRHGDHSAANGIVLCGTGTTGCHGWVHAHPELAYAHGWMVHSWDDPESVPWTIGPADTMKAGSP